jgi:hypothetical protein
VVLGIKFCLMVPSTVFPHVLSQDEHDDQIDSGDKDAMFLIITGDGMWCFLQDPQLK